MPLDVIGPGFGRTGTNSLNTSECSRSISPGCRRKFPPHRLLTFDLGEGWQPLCDFLEVEAPDVAFPRTNSSKEFVDEEWKQG
jgi:hypothetical protein